VEAFSWQAATSAARAELLLPAEAGFLETDGLKKTCYVTQNEISASVDIQSSQKVFDLEMEKFGPYRIDYTRDGRYLVMAGELGHIGLIDWMKNRLYT
jgi:U3 small nucleolar RNA-associated protein 7